MPATTDLPTDSIRSDHQGHSHCVFCGSQNPHSLRVNFRRIGSGVVEGQFEAGAELEGYENRLHGGIIAGLLDAAMTHCLFSEGIKAVTADLRVRFVHPIPSLVLLTVRAWITSSSPVLFLLKSEIILNGTVMARAEGKFMPLRSAPVGG